MLKNLTNNTKYVYLQHKSNKMIKKSKSEQALLQTGRELFWKYGFRRVSVDELCSRAGVSKMTFYRYFADKADLARAVFKEEVVKAMDEFRALMTSDLSGAEKVKGMLQLKAKSARNISKEFLTDFYQHNDTGLREFIEKLSLESWNQTVELMLENQQKGVFRPDLNLHFFLILSQKFMDLAFDEQMIAAAGGPEQLILELSNLLAFGIAGNSSPEP